jgi:hypothetical protein
MEDVLPDQSFQALYLPSTLFDSIATGWKRQGEQRASRISAFNELHSNRPRAKPSARTKAVLRRTAFLVVNH